MSWPQIKKIIILKCLLFFYITTTKPFFNRIVTCDKRGFYMTAGDDQLSGWTEKRLRSISQSQTYTKTIHGHCLVVCHLSGPLQLSESQWNHYIWEVCSANQWDTPKTASPVAGTGQQEGPSPSHLTTLHVTQPKLQKLNVLGYVPSFASFVIFTWPLANLGLPLLQASQQLFAGKMLPQPARGRKCFPRVHQISKHRLFTLQEKTNISCWQKCVDCNDSYFD